MSKFKSLVLCVTACLALAGCQEETGPTYANDYTGDWYETEENGTLTNAVKLALSDQSYEISTSTFNADGENPEGYKGVAKGSVNQLSGTQIYMKTDEIFIADSWYSKESYTDYLINAGLSQIDAENQADSKFTDATVDYSLGADPTRLILGTGIGTGNNYSNMTYYISFIAALKSTP